jgi:hypothetical protein
VTHCIYCLSVWVAAFLYLLTVTGLTVVVYVLAIAGAALMLSAFSSLKHL